MYLKMEQDDKVCHLLLTMKISNVIIVLETMDTDITGFCKVTTVECRDKIQQSE